jgi:LPS-assembly protein
VIVRNFLVALPALMASSLLLAQVETTRIIGTVKDQTFAAAATPPISGPPAASLLQPNQPLQVPRPDAPPPGEWKVSAAVQIAEGRFYKLRGRAELESSEMLMRADEIDYNEETGYIEARGNCFFQHFVRNEELHADKVEYYLDEGKGYFYNVRGSGRAHIDARPGVLTSNNPFYFQGEWAERLGHRYILHNGWVTDCKIPNPWWILKAPRFDIVPGERAIAYHSTFRLRNVPLFYTPFFRKSLEKVPRQTGFLAPNIGNSSRRGKMIGIGYFWAINRSHDVTYRAQYFTARGLAHHVDLSGKPRQGTDFNAILYGVQDRGREDPSGKRVKEGGFTVSMGVRSNLGRGFYARAEINYLSSLLFRQAFTESFTEAISSESHSVGFVTRHWSSFAFNAALARLENFQSLRRGDSIVIRKLPEVSFASRDRRVWKNIPVWVSLESAAGLLHRRSCQPDVHPELDCSEANGNLFQTRRFLERLDLQPRVTAALRWKDFHLIPSFSIRETHYGERLVNGIVLGQNINRSAREFNAELILPALARTFQRKSWLGEKVKHVIEPRASFRHVSGVEDFNLLIRFDETELLSNTTEAEISVANRIYAKRGDTVSEVFSWQLWQRRYFDPDFGGAVEAGRRNVVLSSVELTPYTFLDRPRRYSPVVSVFRASPNPALGVEWRSDYDPLRGHIVNSSLTADFRVAKYFISASHNHLRSSPLLTPNSNQLSTRIGFGDQTRRGWNAAFSAVYDYRVGTMQFALTQVTYNTNCCGISVQYRRFNFGARNEKDDFRVAFSVANIGSFGTLKKQERLF